LITNHELIIREKDEYDGELGYRFDHSIWRFERNVESVEPPFTRAEIDALIDAYPETHKVILKKEDAKRLGFELDDLGKCYYGKIIITVWCATENQPDITLNDHCDILQTRKTLLGRRSNIRLASGPPLRVSDLFFFFMIRLWRI
jgi:hypothetical protein